MKTIFRNELPPSFTSWTEFVTKLSHHMTAEMFVYYGTGDQAGKTWYITPDFAKARALG